MTLWAALGVSAANAMKALRGMQGSGSSRRSKHRMRRRLKRDGENPKRNYRDSKQLVKPGGGVFLRPAGEREEKRGPGRNYATDSGGTRPKKAINPLDSGTILGGDNPSELDQEFLKMISCT